MSFNRLSLTAPARKHVRAVTLSAAAIAGIAMPTLASAATVGSTHTPSQHVRAASQTSTGSSGSTATATNASASTSDSSSSSTSGDGTYTVVSGDTLYGIAQSKLGDGNKYHELFNLNKNRTESDGVTFTNADAIDVGWTILLPGSANASSSSSDNSATTGNTTSSSSTSGSTASSDSSSNSSSDSSSTSGSTASSSTDSSSSTSSTSYADDLDGWINQAIAVMNANGISAPSYNAIYQTAMNESSGNPTAENDWDSNAAAGTPSIGLMQMIQPTFDAYALSGYNDITNPVDNIIAASQYANATYGGLDNVVAARCGGTCWYGY